MKTYTRILIAILISSIQPLASAVAQTWIWYPGDMEVWMGNRANNLRTENGSFYPAFWRADSHQQTVEFRKTIDLAEPEEVEIAAEGKYGIRIDNHGYLFGMPKSFAIPKGRHSLYIVVNNTSSPPALWLKGKTLQSDTTWTVTDYADATQADTWWDSDGSPMFAMSSTPPSCYHLPVKLTTPIKVEFNGHDIFAEFERETIGYLQLHGIKGKGQVDIWYGESPAEARDKGRSYLCDKLLVTVDSIIDLATLSTEVRPMNHQSPFNFQLKSSRAMRYVTVELRDGISVDSISLMSEMKDLKMRGSFECSDTLLNKIWQVGAYTLQLTDREVMIEGIKRDRWMWSGDAIQSYLMNYYSLWDAPGVKRTIWALRGKDPVRQHINTILDYTFYWFNSVYDYYLYTGDREFVQRIYPRMQTLMQWVESRLNSRGMVEGKPGDWVFVDWSPKKMSKSGELSFEQMVYLRSLEAMQLCAGIVGNNVDAQKYTEAANRLKAQLTPTFWDKSHGWFVHTTAGAGVTRYANMFAVLYGYADEQQRESILHNVLLNDSVMNITTPYMRFYELEALCALGEHRRVLKEMRSYWGGMLNEGATTFWETYDPKEKYPQRLAMYGHPYAKSLCHAWGASPLYLLGKYYLGVKPVKPGYEEWECRPVLGDLKWMRGDVPTPHGNIHIEMDKKRIIIEATGCGNGTLIVGNKHIKIESNKKQVIRT